MSYVSLRFSEVILNPKDILHPVYKELRYSEGS